MWTAFSKCSVHGHIITQQGTIIDNKESETFPSEKEVKDDLGLYDKAHKKTLKIPLIYSHKNVFVNTLVDNY